MVVTFVAWAISTNGMGRNMGFGYGEVSQLQLVRLGIWKWELYRDQIQTCGSDTALGFPQVRRLRYIGCLVA